MPAIVFRIFFRILQFNLPVTGMAKVVVYTLSRMGVLLTVVLVCPFLLYAQYTLRIKSVDKDSAFVYSTLRLTTDFKNEILCKEYIDGLPALLQSKGYPAASIDSVFADQNETVLFLYVGDPFQWGHVNVDSVDKKLLDAISWNNKAHNKQGMSIQQVQAAQQRMLEYLENNGYPFAKIQLDSVSLDNHDFSASLKVYKGPLYKIDSIRNYGTAKISAVFLQRYLGILNGSIYKKEKLQTVSKKLNDLPYLQERQPWNLTMLGTGSVLNVYLAPRRSSQINVLVGFLPSSSETVNNKLQVTGEATINLKNSLGGGESIGIDWQQIQPKSPRLDLSFQQPYLFGSPFGVNFNFNLFKKDSSYVNIDMQLGAQYTMSANQSGSVFIQNFQTNVLTLDTISIKNTHILPQEADISSINLGINWQWFNTDYRFNPRKGNEFQITAVAGSKKIKKNSVIINLKDESDPSFDFNSLYDTVKLNSYQFRLKGSFAHFFKLTRFSTLKTAASGGWFQSPTIFRNELFQLGGYKLLRGFDEESIFASQYAVGTLEYRYLVGRNSFLFCFADVGWSKNAAPYANISNNYWGTGFGMAFETKAGIFNISYAVGKRNDTNFDLRQSKIHIGYVNYF